MFIQEVIQVQINHNKNKIKFNLKINNSKIMFLGDPKVLLKNKFHFSKNKFINVIKLYQILQTHFIWII